MTGALRDLDGASVLVTGASSGIGAATAERAGAAGAEVVLAARREAKLAGVGERVEAAGGQAHAVPTDVTDPDAVGALVETAVERTGGLDAAVVNAGTAEPRDAPLEADEFARVTRTNVDGAFHTARAALGPLREAGGAVVFVGSYLGKHPGAATPVYDASKWWLRGFARSLAARHGETVGVSVVNPSGVRTEFGHDGRDRTNEERYADGEVLSAAQVAASVVFCLRQTPPANVAELDLFRRGIR
ncbi:MAG: SDR family NAD(P)-dependent oxidoreductase [Haloferacaceae archaeon]|jgi:NADP-dependent 3-hydroxy acid dehydrogenase YdfG